MSSHDVSKLRQPGIPDPMSKTRLEGINTAMLVITSLFFAARVAIRIAKRKPFELHDFFCYLAYICFVSMWVMYLKENEPLYRIEGVREGEIPIYSELLHDSGMIYRWLDAAQLLFYATLTLVKISLLALYRRLLDRTPPKFTIMWWVILVFCILAFIGSCMTTIFACDDHKAKYNQGVCDKPSEKRRAQFSLWFAYSVDVATDLTVMFLPFRLTWNLQIPRAEKIGVFVLFGSGWVCIAFATLRAVQVGIKDGLPMIPDPTWLEMWTVIEAAMSVIIGCAPAFAAIISSQLRTKNASYNARGYVKQSTDDMKMDTLGSGSVGRRQRKEDTVWADDHGSEDALADEGGLITVVTTVDQEDTPARPSTTASAQTKP